MRKLSFIGFEISGGKVVKRMSIGLVLFFLIQAKSFITFPIYTRTLDKSGYGLLSLIMVTSGILFPLVKIVVSFGFRVNSIHLTDPIEVRKNFTTTLFPALIFTVLNLLLFNLIDLSGIDPQLNQAKWLISILVLAMILKEQALVIPETYQKARIIAVFTTIAEGISAALAIVFVIYFQHVAGIVLPTAFTYSVCAIVMLYLIFSSIGFEWHIDLKKLLKYTIKGLPIIPVGFFLWVMQSLDQYFIAYFYDTQKVGLYAAAYSLSGFILYINPAIDFAFGATILKLWNEKQTKTFFTYNINAFKWVLFFVCGACAIGYLFAKPVIILMASHKFQESAIVLPLLILAHGFFLLTCMGQRVLYTAQKTMGVLIVYALAAGLNFGLNYYFIPSMGIYGAALATFFSYGFSFILISIMEIIYFKFNIYLYFRLYTPVLITLGFLGIVRFVIHPYYNATVLLNLFLALVYVIFIFTGCFYLGFIEKDEIIIIRHGWQKIRHKLGLEKL